MLAKTVYLGLGSNVGERQEMLQAAIDRLQSRELRILRVSSVYETEPQGRRNQRWFLNLVVEAETDLFPRQLLGRIAKIERQLGRQPGIHLRARQHNAGRTTHAPHAAAYAPLPPRHGHPR